MNVSDLFLIMLLIAVIFLALTFFIGFRSGEKISKGMILSDIEFFKKLRESTQREAEVLCIALFPPTRHAPRGDKYCVVAKLDHQKYAFSLFFTLNPCQQPSNDEEQQDISHLKYISACTSNTIIFENEFRKKIVICKQEI
jgi:hypothetical protein